MGSDARESGKLSLQRILNLVDALIDCIVMNPRRVSPLPVVCIVLAILNAGCRTNYYNISRIINEPEPGPASIRNSFGVAGALPANVSPEFYFSAPLNKSAGAEKGAIQTFGSMEKAT